MEELPALIIPALFAVLLVRSMLAPLAWIWKLVIHSGCGFACLWLINLIAPFTGVWLPVNGVTVLTAGCLGLPGIALVTLLEVMP